MSDTAIRIENLGKQYRIGGTQRRHKTFQDALLYSLATPVRWLRGERNSVETFWALDDISFEIKKGDAVGIIGRNGAGKSTLLKILSRITKPTKGRVDLYGRVASLLEVGTGFHSELSGRDNIYLNGAILGMSRRDIDRKFDEIVDFSGVGKFLDTPVKHYSSGMYVRLAFAVAAHLEPEILVVDEVLAVGDAEFQKKCLGKMGDVAQAGRTVLFVSHNMAAISNLCASCVWIDKGNIRRIGQTADVIDGYLSDRPDSKQITPGVFDLTYRKNHYGSDLIMREVRLENALGVPQDTFLMGKNMKIVVELDGLSDYRAGLVGLLIYASDGRQLTSINTQMSCSHIDEPRMRKQKAILDIHHVPFTPGTYSISFSVTDGNSGRVDFVDNAAAFHVLEADVYGTGFNVSAKYGVMYLDATWKIMNS